MSPHPSIIDDFIHHLTTKTKRRHLVVIEYLTHAVPSGAAHFAFAAGPSGRRLAISHAPAQVTAVRAAEDRFYLDLNSLVAEAVGDRLADGVMVCIPAGQGVRSPAEDLARQMADLIVANHQASQKDGKLFIDQYRFEFWFCFGFGEEVTFTRDKHMDPTWVELPGLQDRLALLAQYKTRSCKTVVLVEFVDASILEYWSAVEAAYAGARSAPQPPDEIWFGAKLSGDLGAGLVPEFQKLDRRAR